MPHEPDDRSARAELLAGARDQLPILLGVAPLGMIFGALAISAGLSPLAAQGFSLFIFAGSAQLIALGMVSGNVSPAVVIFTILVVNLRHALYSATLAPRLRNLPYRWKAALSWLLTDEAFAVASTRYQRGGGQYAHWYTLGTGMALWASWQVSTALGITLGSQIPEGWALDFALPLTFLALITPSLTDRPTWAAALTAGLLSLTLASLPYKLNLLLAALCGVGIGLAYEALTMKPTTREAGEI